MVGLTRRDADTIKQPWSYSVLNGHQISYMKHDGQRQQSTNNVLIQCHSYCMHHAR